MTAWPDFGWAKSLLAMLGMADYAHAGALVGCLVTAFAKPFAINAFTDSTRVAARAARLAGDFIEWILCESQRKKRLAEVSTRGCKSLRTRR